MPRNNQGADSSLDNFWDGLIDFFLILVVCISPWLMGAEEAPYHVILIFLGFLAFSCAFIRAYQSGSFLIPLDPPIWIFTGLILLGLVQIIPLPLSILKWVSPASVDFRSKVLPETPDSFDGIDLPWNSFGTISFHPYSTKQFIYQVLVLLLFYIVARVGSNNVKRVTKLCWCLLANGSLLAFQAITQSFTSPPDMVYWTFPFSGSAFGPMNRDHFPDYMNLCIGASCALLTVVYHQGLPPLRSKYPRTWEKMLRPFWEALNSPMELLQNPANLWVLLGLTFMVASVPMSGSRGGFGGMMVGLLIALGFSSQNLKKGGVPVYLLWLIPIITFFFAFIGWSFLESRVVASSSVEMLKKEGRWMLWLPLLDLVQKFPIFGTGFGTFLQVEHLVRVENLQGLTVDYAHNEYLEALVEGGLLRLFLSLGLVLVVFQKTIKALQIHRDQSHALLPAGICWGLSALAVHSFLDFGLHFPAVAITAVVLLAKLHVLCEPLPVKEEIPQLEESNLEQDSAAVISPERSLASSSGRSSSRGGRERHRVRQKVKKSEGPTDNQGVMLAGFILVTFFFILGQSVVYARVESLLVASRSARAKGNTEKELNYLNDALKIAPSNAMVHEALGISLTLLFNEDVGSKRRIQNSYDQMVVLDSIAYYSPSMGSCPNIPIGMSVLKILKDRSEKSLVFIEDQKKKHFQTAVYSLEKARSLFPILYRVHANLAILAPVKTREISKFKTDPPSVHLERALFCFPIDLELQFSKGHSVLLEGDRKNAADHFNASLTRGKTRLPDIVRLSRDHFSTNEILNYIFPADPALILQAMPIIAPNPTSNDRIRVLAKIMSLVAENKGKIDVPLLLSLFGEMENSDIPPVARLEVIKNLPDSLTEDKAVSLEIASVFEEAGLFREAKPFVDFVLSKEPKNERALNIKKSILRFKHLFPDPD